MISRHAWKEVVEATRDARKTWTTLILSSLLKSSFIEEGSFPGKNRCWASFKTFPIKHLQEKQSKCNCIFPSLHFLKLCTYIADSERNFFTTSEKLHSKDQRERFYSIIDKRRFHDDKCSEPSK